MESCQICMDSTNLSTYFQCSHETCLTCSKKIAASSRPRCPYCAAPMKLCSEHTALMQLLTQPQSEHMYRAIGILLSCEPNQWHTVDINQIPSSLHYMMVLPVAYSLADAKRIAWWELTPNELPPPLHTLYMDLIRDYPTTSSTSLCCITYVITTLTCFTCLVVSFSG
jgi:hypothetical protein